MQADKLLVIIVFCTTHWFALNHVHIHLAYHIVHENWHGNPLQRIKGAPGMTWTSAQFRYICCRPLFLPCPLFGSLGWSLLSVQLMSVIHRVPFDPMSAKCSAIFNSLDQGIDNGVLALVSQSAIYNGMKSVDAVPSDNTILGSWFGTAGRMWPLCL